MAPLPDSLRSLALSLALLVSLRPVPAFAESDCTFRPQGDPDGIARRHAASRATQLFASSHPAAAASAGTSVLAGQGFEAPVVRIPRVNYVDDEIFGTMDAARVDGVPILPSPLASDAEFLRRVTLDLTGRIPDAALVTAFLADHRSDKRSRMVDTLLASDACVDRWALFFDDLFRNTAFPPSGTGRLGAGGRNVLHAYFTDALRSHKPYDQMARELITGVGDSYVTGAVDFAVRDVQNNGPIRGPTNQDTFDNLAATAGTVFLGMNSLFCTSCHNGAGHLETLSLWGATKTRQDFWGMAAFFAKAQFLPINQQQPGIYEFVVTDNGRSDYSLSTQTGNKAARVPCSAVPAGEACNPYPTVPPGVMTITPKYVMNGQTPLAGEGYRAALARLVTADPQFAKAAANYIFKEMFGTGIVEPPDGFDLLRQDPAGNLPPGMSVQPTHPNLLVELGQDFAAHGFDLRALLATLAKSNAYQLSSFYPGTWNDAYAPYYARHDIRRLGAEMLVDAITKATGVPLPMNVNGYANTVSWAVQLPDTLEPSAGRGGALIRTFLDTFLRGNRDNEPRAFDFSIAQALYAMNNDTVVVGRMKSTAAGSTVNRLLAQKATPATIVSTLYLTTLSRLPSPAETATALALFSRVGSGQTTASVADDLQFALLNKLDFLFNY
jgi:Protein of unknown function (DUF1549)/Protein of unknown function (DUF1553)